MINCGNFGSYHCFSCVINGGNYLSAREKQLTSGAGGRYKTVLDSAQFSEIP